MTQPSFILNALIAYGALQAFFISVILFRSGSKSLFKKFFAVLLVIEGIILFERLMVETGMINAYPHFLGISYPISFLKPTLMWLMASAMIDKKFKIKKKMYLHLIPFGLMLLLNLPLYVKSGQEKLDWAQAFMEKVPSYSSFDFYFSLSFFAYIGIYIFQSIRKLDRFRSQVANNVQVNWYRIILIVYSGFLFLHLLYFLYQPIGKLNFDLFNQVSMLSMTFIIQSIAFKLMDKSPLLDVTPPDLAELEERRKHEELIVQQFEQHRIYLDDELSLQKFSEAVELPSSYVSKIVNQKFNCSFKKLVARYRINEAKNRMKNAEGEKVKLIDIAFESGFNNKVSFYRAFKEFENVSPSEYFEQCKNEEK